MGEHDRRILHSRCPFFHRDHLTALTPLHAIEGSRRQQDKTFIINGPHAATIVFICKLDEGNEPRERKVVSFILEVTCKGRGGVAVQGHG